MVIREPSLSFNLITLALINLSALHLKISVPTLVDLLLLKLHKAIMRVRNHYFHFKIQKNNRPQTIEIKPIKRN